MKKIKKWWPLGFTLPLIGWGIYNGIYNDIFWDASLWNIATLGVGVFVTFFLTQVNTDKRKQKECLVHILMQLSEQAQNPQMYMIKESIADTALLNMNKRNMSNKIELLQKYSEKFNIENYVNQMKNHFNSYEETLGNHIHDIATLSKMSSDLERPLKLLNDVVYKAIIELYD